MEFQRHTDIVSSVRELQDVHPDKSLDWACAKLRISRGTYYRYAANVKQGTACVRDRNPGGRPAKFALTDAEVMAARKLVAKHEGSIDFAMPLFADDPACTHKTRELINDEIERAARYGRKPRWPEKLRQKVRVTAIELAQMRGDKSTGNLSLAPRIGLFHRDEQGEDHFIKTHSIWTMDDESANQPYLVPFLPHPDLRDRVDPRYHFKLCRQALFALDIYSAAWLGVEAIGRERDQYRGEDILRFIQHLIDSQGTMPETLILEKGRWMGTAIHGISTHDGHRNVMWGGLDELMRIEHKNDSRGKAWIETAFNFKQRALAQSGEDVGRVRGEFEAASKHWLQIQKQAAMLEEGRMPEVLRDPLALGFMTQQQFEELHAQKMFELNCRSKTREGFTRAVVPNDLLQNAITPRPLPQSERWRFNPIKDEAVIVRGGMIVKSVKEYGQFNFAVNGVLDDVHFENGYRVLIAFDPQMPERGCVIANAETGSKNRHGYKFGQVMLTAPPLNRVPIIDDSMQRGTNWKKKASTAARAGFAQVKRSLTDERATRIRQTLDHQGRLTRVSNRPDPATAATSPPSSRRTAAPIDLEALRRSERAAMGILEDEEQFSGV